MHFGPSSEAQNDAIYIIQDGKLIDGKKGYTELSTQKAGVLFTTKDLKQYALDFAETMEQYKRVQSGLVTEVVSISGTYAVVLESIDDVIAHLDVIVR